MNNFDNLSQDILEEDDDINSAVGGILPGGANKIAGQSLNSSSGEISGVLADDEEVAAVDDSETATSKDDDLNLIDELSSDRGDQETPQKTDTADASPELTGQRV